MTMPVLGKIVSNTKTTFFLQRKSIFTIKCIIYRCFYNPVKLITNNLKQARSRWSNSQLKMSLYHIDHIMFCKFYKILTLKFAYKNYNNVEVSYLWHVSFMFNNFSYTDMQSSFETPEAMTSLELKDLCHCQTKKLVSRLTHLLLIFTFILSTVIKRYS